MILRFFGGTILPFKNFGNNLDLAEDSLGKVLDCDAASCGLYYEELGIYFVECRKIIHIREEAGGLYDLVIIGACSLEDRSYVSACLGGLLRDAALDDLAGRGNDGDLSRSKEKISGNNAL